MGRYWYGYTGLDGDEFILSNYQLVNSPAGCDEGRLICAIYAPAGSSHPSTISQNLVHYIARGKQTSTHQPDSPICAKLFVYTRTA